MQTARFEEVPQSAEIGGVLCIAVKRADSVLHPRAALDSQRRDADRVFEEVIDRDANHE